ncbi:MAG: hypothetical protein V1790_16575 [Planctomycetota bacterium]
MGHGRWTIENQEFNELVNQWHADHVYKHEPRAIPSKLRARLNFRLLATACLNVFLAFYRRNLKPAVRRGASMLNVAGGSPRSYIATSRRTPPRSAVSITLSPGASGAHRGPSPQTGPLPVVEDPRLLSRKPPPANLPHTQNARKLRYFQHFRAHLLNRCSDPSAVVAGRSEGYNSGAPERKSRRAGIAADGSTVNPGAPAVPGVRRDQSFSSQAHERRETLLRRETPLVVS